MLIKLVPVIESSGNRRYNGVNALGGTAEAHNVGNVGGNDWSIDGVPDFGNGYAAAYLPYSTTIQEYKVETQNFDASLGHTSGASIAIMTKSGGNDYHGDLTWQFWNQRWNGTRFFVKQDYYKSIEQAEAAGNHTLAEKLRNGPRQPSGHSNDYAGALGGAVRIPHIVNGKNKLFFFFTNQGQQDVVIRKKEMHDGAIPSGNSIMAGNLYKLSKIFNISEWEARAVQMLTINCGATVSYPTSFGLWASF